MLCVCYIVLCIWTPLRWSTYKNFACFLIFSILKIDFSIEPLQVCLHKLMSCTYYWMCLKTATNDSKSTSQLFKSTLLLFLSKIRASIELLQFGLVITLMRQLLYIYSRYWVIKSLLTLTDVMYLLLELFKTVPNNSTSTTRSAF